MNPVGFIHCYSMFGALGPLSSSCQGSLSRIRHKTLVAVMSKFRVRIYNIRNRLALICFALVAGLLAAEPSIFQCISIRLPVWFADVEKKC